MLSLTITLLPGLKQNSRDFANASQDDTARLEEVAEGVCTMQKTASKGMYTDRAHGCLISLSASPSFLSNANHYLVR